MPDENGEATAKDYGQIAVSVLTLLLDEEEEAALDLLTVDDEVPIHVSMQLAYFMLELLRQLDEAKVVDTKQIIQSFGIFVSTLDED